MDSVRPWRSLREYHDPESGRGSREQEFGPGVTDSFSPAQLEQMSRKRFLALLAASTAFAAAGCSDYRDKGEIVPYARKPEEITPGVANLYASTCTGCSQHCGILVKTREGRPIKIDGNPDHPMNLGKICARGQASILDLYDPARLRNPRYGAAAGRFGDVSWEEAEAEIRNAFEAAQRDDRTILLITHPVTSPTGRAVLDNFRAAYPNTQILVYDREVPHNRLHGWKACYGNDLLPAIRWKDVDIILALESDFLGTEGFTVRQTREFASRRDILQSSHFNRLYVAESQFSLTGANADYRLRLRPEAQLELVYGIINEICLQRKAAAADSRMISRVADTGLSRVAGRYDLDDNVLRHLVDDLLSAPGKAMVHAGDSLSRDTHVAVNYLNELLGARGLLQFQDLDVSQASLTPSPAEEIRRAVQSMAGGTTAVVVHLGTNPLFHFPPEFEYGRALAATSLSVSLTLTEDETSARCTYTLPIHHGLEAWGDYATQPDLLSTQQPLIAPLYNTRQMEAVLLAWSRPAGPFTETAYHEYLMRRWEQEVYPRWGSAVGFRPFWLSVLHDGIAVSPAQPAQTPAFRSEVLANLPVPSAIEGTTLLITNNHFIGDGRSSGNGWLQELPHPLSKIVWDNYAALSPALAEALSVQTNDLITIASEHGQQTFPVFVQPGMADGVVAVALGYGRTVAGPVGTQVGVDVGPLAGFRILDGDRIIPGVSVRKTDGRYELASTQEHHALDDAFVKNFHQKRHIIREGVLEEYRKDPASLAHTPPELFSISKEVEYHGVKWAMSIDLNKCTGCNACVAGCSVENNIPVVGKDQVAKGREMQWIRIDRYFAGTPDNPVASHQPMLCQHCDNAPCENVCPVVATTHSPDGLNQMTYNRCVGTKYCSNNCPYKVRRFNFFNFRNEFADGYYQEEPVSLVQNPEVTVRSRGVMEKCTFCVQRITESRQHAAERGDEFTGSDVTTACQQACPADAIVFGNMNDPGSPVARLRKHPLGYHVLEDLNVRPNVTYMTKLRNIHPEDKA